MSKAQAKNQNAQTEVVAIALNKLDLDPEAIRTGESEGIEELADSLRDHDQLQNLVVIPKRDRNGKATGRYIVKAGNRRTQAFTCLRERGDIEADHPVDCKVVADERALEAAIVENQQRKAMHPLDQFIAFQRLAETGWPVEDIAARHGVSPLVVRRRLLLANVSPRLQAEYRAERMSLQQLMAFTVTEDHAAQEAVWFDAPAYMPPHAHGIRRQLLNASVPAGDRRVAFIGGVDAYRDAGGHVQEDLFAERAEDGLYLTDPALLDQLVAARLEDERGKLLAAGWRWVEIVASRMDARAPDGERVFPRRADNAEALHEQIDQLREQLSDVEEDDSLSDEGRPGQERSISEQIEALEAQLHVWDEADKARAGCFVFMDFGGQLGVEAGWIRAEDREDTEDADDDGKHPAATPAVGQDEKGPGNPEALSHAVWANLTAHRTAAARAALADDPDAALLALVHHLYGLISPRLGGRGRALDIGADPVYLDDYAEDLTEQPGHAALRRKRDEWKDQLGAADDGLWDRLAALSREDLLALLAVLVAHTVNGVQPRNDVGGTDAAQFMGLTEHMDLDMREWWSPTPALLGRLKADTLLQALEDSGQGLEAPPKKKSILVELATVKLRDSGWLPAPLRCRAVDHGDDET